MSNTNTGNNSVPPSTSVSSNNSLSVSQQQQHHHPPGGPTSPQGATSSSVQNSLQESVIQRLITQGYQRQDVIEALTNCDGDEQKASMALFAKFVKF